MASDFLGDQASDAATAALLHGTCEPRPIDLLGQLREICEILREEAAQYALPFTIELQAAGLDVLYVGFSSGLSTTYQSGCIAADELREILWLETGAVTPLALLNAPDVTLYLDEALLGGRIAVHPNTNTATVWLQTADLVSLLRTQCVPVVTVPFPCLARYIPYT